MRRSLMQENGSLTLELERYAERAAPELESAQPNPGDVVGRSIEGSKISHVSADADVLREESHHAATDVEPEVVLARDVEDSPDVLHLGSDESDATDRVWPNGSAMPTNRCANDEITGQRRDIAVVCELEAVDGRIGLEEVRRVAEIEFSPKDAVPIPAMETP